MNLFVWLRCEWDRVAAFFLVGLGALSLFLGYQGIKGSPHLAEQMAYISSGGLGGIFCLGLGVGLLLSADLHDEWRKLDRIESAMRGQPLPDPSHLLDRLRRDGDAATPPAGERKTRDHAGAPSGPSRQAVGAGASQSRGAMAVSLDWQGDTLPRALLVAGAVLVLPAALMATGWRKAARTADLDIALNGVALAISGLVLALAVIGLYVFWLRQRTARREGRLFGVTLLEQQLAEGRRQHLRPPPAAEPVDAADVLTAPGLHRFHRPNCPTLQGIEASPVPRSTVDARLTPCQICGA